MYVHSSYDAQDAGEQFPVTLDYREKEIRLMGGHPSESVVDASHASPANVLEVVGEGHADYRNNPLVQNLRIVEGDVGLRIRAAPYASFKDIVCWKTGSHGILVDCHEEDGTMYGMFGVTFRNCITWNCGGNGFRLHTGAHPLSTSFYGCDALLNGGAGVRLRGYASRWHGGTIQNNASFGVDARSGCAQQVDGTYFEGNGAADDAPIEVYVDDSAPGFTLRESYFQGGYFRDFANGRNTGRWGGHYRWRAPRRREHLLVPQLHPVVPLPARGHRRGRPPRLAVRPRRYDPARPRRLHPPAERRVGPTD